MILMLVAFLRAQATLAALVGTRIYPLSLPQGATLPALTYQGISTVPEASGDNRPTSDTTRLQIDSWGASYEAVREVAAALRAALDGYTEELSGGTVASMRFANEHEEMDPERRWYRVTQDYLITWE